MVEAGTPRETPGEAALRDHKGFMKKMVYLFYSDGIFVYMYALC